MALKLVRLSHTFEIQKHFVLLAMDLSKFHPVKQKEAANYMAMDLQLLADDLGCDSLLPLQAANAFVSCYGATILSENIENEEKTFLKEIQDKYDLVDDEIIMIDLDDNWESYFQPQKSGAESKEDKMEHYTAVSLLDKAGRKKALESILKEPETKEEKKTKAII